MLTAKVIVVYDLEAPAAKRAESIRKELLDRLVKGEIKHYDYYYKGLSIRHLAGSLIEVAASNSGPSGESPLLLSGLAIRQVIVEDDGTDHFPVPGLYHYSNYGEAGGRSMHGVTATVRWKTETRYPAREEFVESVVKAEYENRMVDVTVTMPVVVTRTWSLRLSAPSVARAERGYAAIVGGTWHPKTLFVDVLPDNLKIRQVPVGFVPHDSGEM